MLDGIRVIDLTESVPGAFATKQLADFGADVVKVETPRGGDPTRRLPPFRPNPAVDSVRSAYFCYLNTNKRSVALDIETATGAALLRSLVGTAHVLVDSYPASRAERLGLTADAVSERWPGIVHASITPFGRTGPYQEFRAPELVLYGMGGEMYSTGIPDREPLKLAGHVAEIECGSVAFVAILSSIIAAHRDMGGDSLDISCFEIQMSSIDRRSSSLLGYQYTGEVTKRRIGWVSAGFPSGVYPCADGYFEVSGGPAYWPRIKKMMGDPPELEDPKWTAPGAQADPARKAEFEEIFLTWSLSRTRREIWEAAQRAHAFLGPFNRIPDLFEDPHFRARGVFVGVDDGAGTITMPGRPFLFDGGGWRLRRPAPRLGEHTHEVLTSLGVEEDELRILRGSGVVA